MTDSIASVDAVKHANGTMAAYRDSSTSSSVGAVTCCVHPTADEHIKWKTDGRPIWPTGEADSSTYALGCMCAQPIPVLLFLGVGKRVEHVG